MTVFLSHMPFKLHNPFSPYFIYRLGTLLHLLLESYLHSL